MLCYLFDGKSIEFVDGTPEVFLTNETVKEVLSGKLSLLDDVISSSNLELPVLFGRLGNLADGVYSDNKEILAGETDFNLKENGVLDFNSSL